jgi:hypothetical protein
VHVQQATTAHNDDTQAADLQLAAPSLQHVALHVNELRCKRLTGWVRKAAVALRMAPASWLSAARQLVVAGWGVPTGRLTSNMHTAFPK